MTFKVATWPWLLQHELRLASRRASRRQLGFSAGVVGLFWLGLHVPAWFLGPVLLSMPPRWTPLLGLAVWVIFSLMLAQAILRSVSALFERGDFDLLLSSPLPVRTVFIVRGLGVATACTATYLVMLSPLAHMSLMQGSPRLLAIYPALAALGLLATAGGIGLTLVLVRLVGARRARQLAQLMGALAGAAVFLLSQWNVWAGGDVDHRTGGWLRRFFAEAMLLGADDPLWLPLQALLGRPLPLLVLAAAGAGSFMLVIHLAQRRLLAGTQEPVTGSARRLATAPRASFRRGLALNVVVKEWRLIARDPELIGRTLLQLLYLVPLLLLAVRDGGTRALLWLVPAAVMLSATLASALAWLTVAAEEAPELVGTAPVSLARIRWLKVLAALLPVGLLLLPFALYLLTREPFLAAVFAIAASCACIGAGLTQVWNPRRGDRRNMFRREQPDRWMAMLETLSAMGWAAAAFGVAAWYSLTPLGLLGLLGLLLAPVGPLTSWLVGRSRRAAGVLV